MRRRGGELFGFAALSFLKYARHVFNHTPRSHQWAFMQNASLIELFNPAVYLFRQAASGIFGI